MKQYNLSVFIFSFIFLLSCKLDAQTYFKIELLRIENKLILPDNYTQITLLEVRGTTNTLNKYDYTNLDTFIQIIENAHHERFHILIQEDFIGNITYVAVSNKLSKIILAKTIPNFLFNQCLEQINDGFSNKDIYLQIVVSCILARAELCSEKK